MAFPQVMIRATEDLLLGNITSIRGFDVDTLYRDAYPGIADLTLAQRAAVKPRFEVELVGTHRTGVVAPENAGTKVVAVDVRVKVVTTLLHEVQADDRRGVRGFMFSLLESVRSALAFPGNLVQTAGGSATGATSGCYLRVGPAKVTREDYVAKIFAAEMICRAHIKSDAPTS